MRKMHDVYLLKKNGNNLSVTQFKIKTVICNVSCLTITIYKLIYLFTNMAKKEWDFECPQFVDFERELDSSGKDDVFFGMYIFTISLFFKMMLCAYFDQVLKFNC